MRPEIFDPITGPQGGWPEQAALERAYLTAFAQIGAPALIANVRTKIYGLRAGGRIFPLTVNEAEYGDSYVCLPHTAYALYAREELDLVETGIWRPALRLLTSLAGGLMRAIRINQIVHLNNWMLSTNLHHGWQGEALTAIRQLLVAQFPDHVIAIRSINRWSDAPLADALSADGWQFLPSRQIYVTDDLVRDWAPRRDTKQDLRLLRNTPYQDDNMEQLRAGDAERIAQLYGWLYLDRYSTLNPQFTPAFIEITHRSGLIRYRGLRDATGQLVVIVGCLLRGDILTTPIVGYDTALPRAQGLYRLACVLLTQIAQSYGVRLNSSAGAGEFKRLRGAHGELEYSAFFTAHLSAPRRIAIDAMAMALNRLAVPLIRARGL
ncbi:MAG: hypothetical protein ACP5M1_10680 [Acidiphilium sp.]